MKPNTSQSKKPWVGSALCLCLLSLVVGSATAATLRGSLVNGTTGGAGSASLVELIDLTQGMVPMASLEDVNGEFQFDDVPDVSAAHFLLRVTSEGVAYTNRVGADSFETPMEVAVYEATSDRSQVRVLVHDVLFQRDGQHMQTTELMQFNNDSDPPQVISNAAQPIRIHLPEDIHGEVEVSVGTGSMPLKLSLIETADPGEYTVDYALKPGATRLVVRYLMGYESGELQWDPVVFYPTEERRVLVSPADVSVEAPGMIRSTTDVPEGFVVYAGLALEGGQPWPVHLSGGSAQAVDPHANMQDGEGGGQSTDVRDVVVRPNRLDGSRGWIFGGLGLVFLCAIGLAASSAPASDGHSAPKAQRDQLSRLADRYVSGEIDRPTFEAERDRLLAGGAKRGKKHGSPAKAVS